MKERNMAREAQEENSSSQSVKLTVSSIERGAIGKAVQIGFSDGSSFFIHPGVIKHFGLAFGDSLSAAEVEELKTYSEKLTAKQKALEFLARREHSVAELVLKLRQKGFEQQTANIAVSELEAEGSADDRRFAHAWVESRLRRHPEGLGSLIGGLVSKGVDRNLAEEVAGIYYSEASAADALARAAEKYLRRSGVTREKLTNHLGRRGFSYREIKKYIEDTGIEWTENSEHTD